MLYLDGGSVYIHRGDTASFDIVFGDADNLQPNQISVRGVYGIDWIPEDGTPIRFTVKQDVNKFRYIMQKDYKVMNGFVTIDLESSDTKYLPFGEYVWDVRLSFTDADTIDWNTPFDPFPFFVTEVVGNV